jgi:hypothetical protein
MNRSILFLLIVGPPILSGCKEEYSSPKESATRNTNPTQDPQVSLEVFLSKLTKGMSEDEFDNHFSESLFKNGFIGLPIIISVGDRDRHFNFPGVGPYTFNFGIDGKLNGWHQWSEVQDQHHSNTSSILSAPNDSTH